MDQKKRIFVILTVLCSLAAVGLIVASFATDSWIKGSAEKQNMTITNNTSTNNRGYAQIYFGLFRGKRTIDYGFSPRDQVIAVKCSIPYCLLYNESYLYEEDPDEKLKDVVRNYEAAKNNINVTGVEMYNYGLFPYAYWISTIVFMSLGVALGLVYIGFAIFNIFGKPIETITGPLGLYLWNILSLLLSLGGVIVYLVLYMFYYKKSILPYEDIQQDFVSTANLDSSFYLYVGGVGSLFINLLLLLLSGLKMRCGCTQEAEKIMDNGIILY